MILATSASRPSKLSELISRDNWHRVLPANANQCDQKIAMKEFLSPDNPAKVQTELGLIYLVPAGEWESRSMLPT
jgi:hypothetical protein